MGVLPLDQHTRREFFTQEQGRRLQMLLEALHVQLPAPGVRLDDREAQQPAPGQPCCRTLLYVR